MVLTTDDCQAGLADVERSERLKVQGAAMRHTRNRLGWLLAWTVSGAVACVVRGAELEVGPAEVVIGGQPATVSSASALGFVLCYRGEGSQVATLGRSNGCVASVITGQPVEIRIPLRRLPGQGRVAAEVLLTPGGPAEASLGLNGGPRWQAVGEERPLRFEASLPPGQQEVVVCLAVRAAGDGQAAVQWRGLVLETAEEKRPIPVAALAVDAKRFPPPELPALHRAIEEALIEWDWRMQDGLGTPRQPETIQAAIARTLERGDRLLGDLRAAGVRLDEQSARWEACRKRFETLVAAGTVESAQGDALWREVHWLRRTIALANPRVRLGPLVFVKQPHSIFSHQLTQYNGNCARPGGGLFVLEEPGRSMRCRRVVDALPVGSYQFPEVSYDGRRILFSFCHVEAVAPNRERHLDKFFHLYEVDADGSNLRQLTRGPYDDFAGRYLPDGRIIFVSTRRGGFHRCGQGPCPVHTLALCEADGSNPRPISYHETHEWDPAVLADGRVIYTRWDYVDRNAVFYQQLWTVRPDGTDVRIYYGNNTYNPVGIWEARPVPGSHRVMATAAAHHAMTAGSIVLVDVTRGLDGPAPLFRVTPDALFPESEIAVIRGDGRPVWFNPVGVHSAPAPMPDHQRWPGHCYKSPYPLSETYFLAAYSFDRLIGEPDANPPNMFGLYLVDRFGNKELLYRDLNISSVWPVPLAPRPKPPVLPPAAQAAGPREGMFFLHNVYRSWPEILPGSVKRLRVVQVLPKSTWHINQPTVGLPNASPGRQVLGTVPVEADGSAWFRAPAGVALAFQALDEEGQAVQTMRSITYLQPGETVSCVGCHEPRLAAPPAERSALALRREPSPITPGPDGSKPFSYPILVQPVLDKHCVRCHNAQKPEGNVILTGQPQGRYTASYNALAPRVPYSDWAGKPGDFRVVNSEPMTRPGFFGARASSLMQLLRKGHYDVKLDPEDKERLVTWMDTNALFYGTFDPADQARQQRGERIAGPALE